MWQVGKNGLPPHQKPLKPEPVMENNLVLFRPEAMNHRLAGNLGSMRINVPLHYRLISFFSFLILSAVMLFLVFAQTSEKIFVRGFLDTENGIVAVNANVTGIILQSKVEEGEQVKKGSPLFIISNGEQNKNTALLNNLNQRKNNLQKEYRLKNDHYQAMLSLYKKHFIAASTLKNTETELLELENKINELDLDRINHQQNQTIRAPIDGTITNIFYKPGQAIEQAKTLVQLIPNDSNLIARVYIPSQHIGFLKKNAHLSIKYDAYPAQRFGIYKALVKEINLTVLTDEKEDKPITIGQPYYKIKAELESPFITIYGKKSNLSHGLTFTAVITGQRKKIWQWLLDPIYSYYGETVV